MAFWSRARGLLRPLVPVTASALCKFYSGSRSSLCQEAPVRTRPYPEAETRSVLPFSLEQTVCLELPESDGPLFYRQVLRYIARHGRNARSFRLGGVGCSESSVGLGWFEVEPKTGGASIWALHQTVGLPSGMQLPRLYHSLVLFHPVDGMTSPQAARHVLETMCEDARAEEAEPECGIPLFRFEVRNASWQRLSTRPLRPWDSVVLPLKLKDTLERDASWFHAETTRSRYGDLGIAYHRTYLFSGPPGAGKTSAAIALAGRFGRPLCLLPEPELSDGVLIKALPKAPPRALFIFEDAEVTPEGLRSLLGGLDGVGTPEDVIFVLTTNTPEALEAYPALLRPGRVDLHLRFPPPNDSTAVSLFRRFFGSEAASWEPQGRLDASSMAELQHWLLECDRQGLGPERCCVLLQEVLSQKESSPKPS